MSTVMANNPDSDIDVEQRVNKYVTHLENIARVFTQQARELGLGIRLDPSGAIAAVKKRTGIAKVMRFCDRVDDSGVLHDAQLMTALDCIGELLTSPHHNGLVLGAMQSGKTTTSLAFQFAGPIVYLLTGRCLYPIYLITSHTSQEDQTKIEIARFLDFYGELSVELDDKHSCTLLEYARLTSKVATDPVFKFSPTINTYREHVLKRMLPDTMIGPKLDDFIQRRVPGESIKRIADLCRRANANGFAPLLIIDEPQYGASDRFVKVSDDQIERRACVLLQIFNKIDDALGEDAKDRAFVGLSATPYELHDIDAVWKVNQYLSSQYSGFNYFGGTVIDVEADVKPPRTISFGTFGQEIGIPFLDQVSLNAYDNPKTFQSFRKKTGYVGTHFDYRLEVERALRAAILHMARNGSIKETGICIRLFNNNIRSHRLIERLNLPTDEIEVIEYFGSDHRGKSVKRAIRHRSKPELPFVIAVTNRARMGDAFPRQVEWFLEFSKKAANLNALLQGLLGRACGYGKRSTVIMSDENAQLVEDYKRERGNYIYKTSPHSIVVGTFRRGAPTSLVRLFRDMNDPLITEFFGRVDREVVKPYILQNSATLRSRRARNNKGYRTGPLLRIAEELNLFEHLESLETREKLFPTYPEFRIARADDEVEHSRFPDKTLKYTLDETGDCRFTFREWTSGLSNHGGVRSRGYGGRDANDRGQAGDTLEPQINMRKYDPTTGKAIDDKRIDGELVDRQRRRPGHWRAEMITLPLVSAVRELQAGEATYPVKHSPFAALMSEDEKTKAGLA